MFGIVHADDDNEFEMFEQWHIERAELVFHIKDQGSFPKSCYERLDAPAQKEVMSQLAQYAMFIVIGLSNIRTEHDENNEPFEQDAPPVMLNQIVKLRHGDFIEQVLDPYRDHFSKFWCEESIDQVEEGHRYLLKMYNEDMVLHVALDKHDVQTTFNDGTRCHSKHRSSACAPSSADWPPPLPTRLLSSPTSPFSSGRWMSSALA
jgi:hypothetical protein